MAQTPRSIDDLETLLADNEAGAISAQDVRDLMESALGCYGQLKTDGGSTAESLSATPAEIDTWLTSGPCRNTTPDITSPVGELQLDADGIWALHFDASFLVTGATDRFDFELRADDVAIAGAQAQVTGTLGERVAVSMTALYSATSGVGISVYAAAIGAAGDITIEHARLTAFRVG